MSLHLPLAVAFPYWFMPLRLVPLRAEVVAAVVVAAVVVAAVVVAAVVRPFKEDQEQAGDINFPIIIKAKSVRDVTCAPKSWSRPAKHLSAGTNPARHFADV